MPAETAPPTAAQEQPILVHHLRLADRLYAFVLIRFMVILGMVAGAVIGREFVGIADLDVRGFSVLALALLLANLLALAVVAPFHRHPERALLAQRRLVFCTHFTIAADFICLTAALWLLGGGRSTFQAFFTFHVIIASVLLSARAAYGYALFGYLLFAGLVIGVWQGFIPDRAPAGVVLSDAPLEGRYVLTVLVVQGMLIASTALLLTYLMRLLRAGEERLLESNRELSRVSQQRKDFMKLAVHNLRSPLAAIGMYFSNLRDGYGGELTAQQREWVGRSQVRLRELLLFLKDLEHLVALESRELEAAQETIDTTAMLQEVASAYEEEAKQRGHRIVVETEHAPPIQGIPRLLREAVVNYVMNAIKYCAAPAAIRLRARQLDAVVRIEVEDSGPGIPAEDQQRLFREFVRLPSRQSAEVPGSGLGLYIVRQIAEAHRGRAGVDSVPGQGSVFYLEIPR